MYITNPKGRSINLASKGPNSHYPFYSNPRMRKTAASFTTLAEQVVNSYDKLWVAQQELKREEDTHMEYKGSSE